MTETRVGMLQDMRLDPALAGKSYMQCIKLLAGDEAHHTPALQAMWGAFKRFEPQPRARHGAAERIGEHQAKIVGAGSCLRSVVTEGDMLTIDDKSPIRPGDAAAFVYRTGLTVQCKIYLGRWVGGDHSLVAGDRRIDAVCVFFQENPATVVLVPEDDLVGAVRVTSIRQWAANTSRRSDLAWLRNLIDVDDLDPTPVGDFLQLWDAEYLEFTNFLISRCNAEEMEAFYQKYPQARAIAEAAEAARQ